MHETLFARPSTENPARLRPAPWLSTCPCGVVRRESILPGEVAAAAPYQRRDCPAAPRWGPSAPLRCSRADPRTPVGPRAAGCHTRGALYSAPPAVRTPGKCAHHVPGAHPLGPATKKKSLHAAERETPRVQEARAIYKPLIAALDVRRLKCIDEAGVNLAMTRLYGRAPKGERVLGTVPQNDGENITLLGALSLEGIPAVMTVNGATDAEVFRTYIKHVLGPTLVPGDI